LSAERLYSFYKATEYVVLNKIPGDIVECGVDRAGSTMVAALSLIGLKQTKRKIYLYDTYEGMTKPTEKDVLIENKKIKALTKWQRRRDGEYANWRRTSLETVKSNMERTGYPKSNLVYVKGKVEETIPKFAPNKIAVLRLDTDWYESTYHEMVHLFPRLVKGGVLILDDYRHWQGSRDAVDKYLSENKIKIFLHRTDESECTGVKI